MGFLKRIAFLSFFTAYLVFADIIQKNFEILLPHIDSIEEVKKQKQLEQLKVQKQLLPIHPSLYATHFNKKILKEFLQQQKERK